MGFSMQPYGIQSMLKEGYRHLSGLEEAVLKNIDACKSLAGITRTSLGPNGSYFSSRSISHCAFWLFHRFYCVLFTFYCLREEGGNLDHRIFCFFGALVFLFSA